MTLLSFILSQLITNLNFLIFYLGKHSFLLFTAKRLFIMTNTLAPHRQDCGRATMRHRSLRTSSAEPSILSRLRLPGLPATAVISSCSLPTLPFASKVGMECPPGRLFGNPPPICISIPISSRTIPARSLQSDRIFS